MAQKMNPLDIASWIVCTLAALHLGAVGAFGFDLVDRLLGSRSMLGRGVSIVIGLLGLYSAGHMLKSLAAKM